MGDHLGVVRLLQYVTIYLDEFNLALLPWVNAMSHEHGSWEVSGHYM